MGKNTKIICTVVPNPTRTKESGKPSFSVFLTPRLPDSGNLKDYYEIVNWFKFNDLFVSKILKVKVASITQNSDDSYTMGSETQLKVERDDTICKSDYKQQYKNRIYTDKEYFKIGTNVWKKLFKENTPVKGWILDEEENNRLTQLFTQEEINQILDKKENKPKDVTGIQTSALTSIEREQLRKKLFNRDLASKKMSDDEIKLWNKENQEFHKKISMLADFPHILRLTGWIFDFQIIDKFQNDSFNIIKLNLSDLNTFVQDKLDKRLWANFSNEVDFKTPWSYFNIKDNSDKLDFSIKYLEKLQENYFQIENGFIRNEGSAYKLIATQFDHKQFKAKLQNANEQDTTNIEENTNRLKDFSSTGIAIVVERKELKDSNNAIIKDNNNPIYQNSPFIVGVNADPASVNSSITINGKKNDSANIDDYIIFGHNLDTGYRIDVSMQKPDGTYTDFKSLCWRNADYKIDTSPYSDKRAFIDLLANFKDEPWISESAQAGKSGTLYVDEELCRWNNWSLTCPHIGNYPQDETNVKENHEFNDLELKNIRPTDKTLTPLRFSRKYKFRIRVVDICGNSISCDIYDNDAKTFVNTPTPVGCEIVLQESFYKRLETVNPPELHFTENVFEGRLKNKKGNFVERKLKSEFHGEDLNTLVVRTKIKNGEIILPKNSVRSVCPPRITQSFVELHGTVDDLLKNPKERKFVYEKASYENTNTDVEIFKPKEEIPFLTDPIINSFEVKVDGLKSSDSGSIWNQKNELYIQRRFSSISLKCIKPFDKYAENVKPDSEAIVVELKAGSILKGSIESIIPDKSIEKNIPDKTSFHSDSRLPDDKGNLVDGKHSEPKELLFINAVQKPVILNDNGTVGFNPIYNLDGVLRKRTPSIPISLAFESLTYVDKKFPLSTTGEIKIIAEYDEIICDKTKEQGFRVEKKKLVKAFSNFGEDISLKVDDNNDSTKLLEVPEFKALEHSFGDTKYRSVKYSIELVSRFKDYFPTENEFNVLGIFNKQIEIENSKKLEALVIDSIVPVFNWTENENEVVRKHETFRIYLEGDWYQNGASLNKNSNVFEEVEKVAVFFLDNVDTIPDEYEGLVSEFGKDPSTNTNNDRTNGLKVEMFGLDKDEKIEDVDITESDFINIVVRDKDKNNITTSYKGKIKAAPFRVKFDLTKKKFFCDIKLNIPKDKQLYFPFLKLAVARYLKTSIREDNKYDYRFSNIVTAPQVQIFPVRKIDKKNNFSIFQSNGDGSNIVNDFASKKLEVYLIMERNNEAEFSKLIDEKAELSSFRCIKLIEQQVTYKSLLDDGTIKDFRPARIYIEEFEVYNVWDTDSTKDFKMDENANYNPRNDIRKRLVFTYKIK